MVLYIPPMWPLLLAISILLVTAMAKRRSKQLPPGPPRLPILGNLHQLGALPHRSLRRLSKKYGHVMFLQLGNVPTIVLSSAEAAKQALRDHDLDCCNRPTSAGIRRLSYNHKDVSFSVYSNHWRQMRKLCVLHLLSAKRLQEFQHIREEEVASLVCSVAQAAALGTPINLTEKAFLLTANVIFKAAFGKSCDGNEFRNRRMQDVVDEAMAVLGGFSASDFFPYVGFIIDRVTGLNARVEKSFYELDSFYQCIIDNHLDSSRKKEEHEDIVDVLLRVEREQHELGLVQFSTDHIKAILMDIFLAGTGTGAVTIIWAMAELTKNPRIMKKAQREVRNYITKKQKLTETDIDKLKYLKMIVKETLRLHPPAPLLVPREALSHFKLNGYNVYPRTRIIVNASAIGRDPDHWENPEEFVPERFADECIDYKGKSFEFIPFGAGRRICPGIGMATGVVELALANLLYCFDWKLPGGMKENDIDMEEAPGLSVPKKSPLVLVPIRYQ